MRRKTVAHLSLYTLAAIATACMAGCGTDYDSTAGRDRIFDNGWKFIESDVAGAESPDFDDTGWRTVDLPHDWSVEDYATQDSLHFGPFFRGMQDGQKVGYLRGGTAWYRKTFPTPGDGTGQVAIHFDGVQSEMELWVNGEKAGEHVYGYTPFYFNITSYLRPPGEENVIAVRVVNPEQNSRWFTGSGIYRHVYLHVTGPVFIDVWGVSITTPEVRESSATVSMDVTVTNTLGEDTPVMVQAEIISPQGEASTFAGGEGSIPGDGMRTFALSGEVENPSLWDIDSPVMYTAEITVTSGGKDVDVYETSFGIRSIEYSAERGFLLNGREVLMKGACMHHDNGLLGAAAFDRAEERRVRIMKENGYNAIRTSHNPPSQSFLDACDRLGMLVIDESFDQWVRSKSPNDYHRHFSDWWRKDTEAMIMRDRNHPSVIMWSIGNEINERADSLGLAIAQEMTDYIHDIEPTRPVTQAICGFWDHPGREWDATAPAFAIMDVGGYNYQFARYEDDHEIHPGRIMFGSESAPMEAYESWMPVETRPHVIGDFVWTGMDYIGESAIGHSIYLSGEGGENFSLPWPWYVSWCGDIDITGNKKPQSYYRDVLWGESSLEMAVHEPVPAGMSEQISYWGWPNEEISWNWRGSEGDTLQVRVYTCYPMIRLELNGREIGTKEPDRDMKGTVTFDVPYEPGELIVTGFENGEAVESRILATTGSAAAVRLAPERDSITAGRGEIVYVDIDIVDDGMSLVPDAEYPIVIDVSGPGELIATGNASPLADGSMQDSECTAFRGRALAIIRSTGGKGAIRVTASSENLQRGEAVITAE